MQTKRVLRRIVGGDLNLNLDCRARALGLRNAGLMVLITAVQTFSWYLATLQLS